MKCLSLYSSIEEQAIHWQYTKQQLRCTIASIKVCQSFQPVTMKERPTSHTRAHFGTWTTTQQYSSASSCGSFFFSSNPGTKASLPSEEGAELFTVSKTHGVPYRTLSLRVARAVCRASSFTASQAGGDPFWSSSFTASTAPSIVPTADLYCSSEGGLHARFARGCGFK